MNEQGANIAELKKILINFNEEKNNIDMALGDSVRILLGIASTINIESYLGSGMKNMAYRTSNLASRCNDKLNLLSNFMNDRITTAENEITQSSSELSSLSSRLNNIEFDSVAQTAAPTAAAENNQAELEIATAPSPSEPDIALAPTPLMPTTPETTVQGIDMSNQIPNGNTGFHSWMSYDAITNRKSGQWKLQQDPNTFTDENGIRRYAHPDNPDGDVIIALGTGFGDQIGTRYKVTTDEGNSYYAILGDNKNPKDSNAVRNANGQSVGHRASNGQISVVEFVVDKPNLDSAARRAGSVGALPDYVGNIASIEKLDVVGDFNWG